MADPKSPKLPPGSLAELLGQLPAPPEKSTFTSIAELLNQFSTSKSPPPAQPTPQLIRDRWFRDQTVYIDGYVFERCRFDNCALVTELANFTFRASFIAPTCRLFFNGPALKLAKLLLHLLRLQQRITPLPDEQAVFPVTTDGTFTIE